MRYRLAALAGLSSALLFRATSAHAVDLPGSGDTARPCRPTVSCTADLAAPGTFEVEAGGYAARLPAGQSLSSDPVLLKQTFTRVLQLQVGSSGYTVVRESPTGPQSRYVDDIVAGPKLHVLDQTAAAPSLALTLQASLPVSAASNDGAFVTGHASKDLGALHVDYNAGVDAWWRGRGGGTVAQPFTALALSASPLAPFGVALEGYVFASAAPYSPRDGGVRVAVSLTPRPWLVFDFGGDAGWFPSTRTFSLFAGMTVIPVVFWRTERGQ